MNPLGALGRLVDQRLGGSGGTKDSRVPTAGVVDATSMPSETDSQREARASRIIAYFQSGITEEKELRILAKQALGR